MAFTIDTTVLRLGGVRQIPLPCRGGIGYWPGQVTLWVELEGTLECTGHKWDSWDFNISFSAFMEAVLKILVFITCSFGGKNVAISWPDRGGREAGILAFPRQVLL